MLTLVTTLSANGFRLTTPANL